MATLNGDNYSKLVSVPMEQANIGDVSGKIRFLYDEITLAADVNSGDVINMGAMIPANARIIDAHLKSGALGTGVTAALGQAGVPAYFIAAASVAAGAKLVMGSEVGYLDKPALPVQPIVTIGGATSSGAAGKKIQISIRYVLE